MSFYKKSDIGIELNKNALLKKTSYAIKINLF